MQATYQATRTMIVRSATQQERGTEASLRGAWVLGKHKKTFTDAEIVKECMKEVAIALFEGTQKDDIIQKINQIPLSDSTAVRRAEMSLFTLIWTEHIILCA